MGSPPPDATGPPPRTARYSRLLFRAPSVPISLGLVALANLLAGVTVYAPGSSLATVTLGAVVVFVVPGLVSAVGTAPLAKTLGGRLSSRRGVLLAFTSSALILPLAVLARSIGWLLPVAALSPEWLALFLLGPMLWFRHMSLFGVSNPSHARSVPASVLQPVLVLGAAFVLNPPDLAAMAAATLFLVFGFLASALLLRAADRPLRREFGVSGVSLIRPLLDHINERDPSATRTLEEFFGRFAIPADLRVTLVRFDAAGGPVATIALPTVHPGPFAALGASDLPRKVSEGLGIRTGVVLVPHTPCNHDLDLPTGAEVDKVVTAARTSLEELTTSPPVAISALISPAAGSLARAQLIGGTALVVVTQAPLPTDDIAFAVADRIFREHGQGTGPSVALIDAHNSYVEDQGDLTYGTPKAERLVADVAAAVAAASRAARPGVLEAGAASRTDYTPRAHGIGPQGIRALVLRAHGTTSAFVLIDGNNLVQGMRQPILDALRGLVDDAEVMTTDNHVVHEVDGGLNPVGERYPLGRIREDCVGVVRAALDTLTPVTVGVKTTPIEGVAVLGPAWTERLLTSLGDTMSMFANAFLTTFLLLVATSMIVLFVLA